MELPPALAVAAGGAYAAAVGGALWLVSREVPQPYMDEVFHVPQAQRYCAGDFASWDPKITTPPGLYLASLPYAGALDAAARLAGVEASLCSTLALRSFNATVALLCLAVLYRTHRALHPATPAIRSLLMALSLSLMPLHAFFTWLYYTDVLSTTLVFAAYAATLRRRSLLAAVLSAAAVTVRQTNAVWAAFNLGVGVLRHLQPEPAKSASQSAAAEVAQLLRMAWTLKLPLLRRFWGLLAVLAGFAAFLRLNGGVVLGDKSNHVTVAHPTQLLYLGLYAAVSFAPLLMWPGQAFRQLLAWGGRHPARMLAVSLAAAAAGLATVHRFTLVHPFILADNRHYVFYIWRRVFSRHEALRYAMVGPYVYAWANILAQLCATQGRAWAAMLLVCCAAALVPAWLVELRYFTIPAMHIALHLEPPPHWRLAATAAGFLLVNVATTAVFLRREFAWDDGSTARFIW
eukprot:jgi/Tetstr1/443933/TSEL_031885.t1